MLVDVGFLDLLWCFCGFLCLDLVVLSGFFVADVFVRVVC